MIIAGSPSFFPALGLTRPRGVVRLQSQVTDRHAKDDRADREKKFRLSVAKPIVSGNKTDVSRYLLRTAHYNRKKISP